MSYKAYELSFIDPLSKEGIVITDSTSGKAGCYEDYQGICDSKSRKVQIMNNSYTLSAAFLKSDKTASTQGFSTIYLTNYNMDTNKTGSNLNSGITTGVNSGFYSFVSHFFINQVNDNSLDLMAKVYSSIKQR